MSLALAGPWALALVLALMETQEGRREHALPDMAAHLPVFPPEPSRRRERGWRLSSEPSFPEKPLSLFVLAPPRSSHALLQLPSSGPRGQGRPGKSPLPSLSHCSWGQGNKAKAQAILGSPSVFPWESEGQRVVRPAAQPPPLQSPSQPSLLTSSPPSLLLLWCPHASVSLPFR